MMDFGVMMDFAGLGWARAPNRPRDDFTPESDHAGSRGATRGHAGSRGATRIPPGSRGTTRRFIETAEGP